MPITSVNGAMIYVRDVANVHDGYAPQTNIVKLNHEKSALMTILKSGDASTLDVVGRIQTQLPLVQHSLPPDLKVAQLFDQSIFVRATISGVVREAVIAALLTGTMILVFLGSWRSTFIVTISIPLSILASIIILSFLHQTMNIMTLGGLALAVGILVDDATVTIENIHRHMEEGSHLRKAILEGAGEIAVPTLVSTLSICMVFVSVVFLTGPAKFLFTPMALSVVFAMAASYILSRTLVPVLTLLMLPGEAEEYQRAHRERTGNGQQDAEASRLRRRAFSAGSARGSPRAASGSPMRLRTLPIDTKNCSTGLSIIASARHLASAYSSSSPSFWFFSSGATSSPPLTPAN